MPPSKEKLIIFHMVIIGSLAFSMAACTTDSNTPANLGGMTQVGHQLRTQGDDAGAAEFYQRTLQHDPHNIEARQALGEIYEQQGDIQTAEIQYHEGLKYDPDNANFLRAYGRVLIKLGRATEARDTYEKAIALDSDDVKALNGLGIALDYLGQHNAAQQAYRTALDNAPDDLTTINNLAHSYVLSGGYNAAITLLEPHITDKAATPALRQNLAEAYGLAGMDADAERVARIDLSPAEIKRNLAYYKTQRAKLGLTPKLYADLGSFATDELAQTKLDAIKAQFPAETDGLVLTITPSVAAAGGTPSFSVRATGFEKKSHLLSFCDSLKLNDIPCKAHIDTHVGR